MGMGDEGRAEQALAPERSFDTIACTGTGALATLAALEAGHAAVLLSPHVANALVDALAGTEVLCARATLGLGVDGRVGVAPLREWLAGCANGGAPLRLVDNALASPYLCRPLRMGADLVVEDLRALAGPQAGSCGGCGGLCVIGRSEASLACLAAVLDVGELGVCDDGLTDAEQRWLLGAFELLSSRVQRACDTALVVANYLAAHERVANVSYPGLAGDAANAGARKVLEHGFGPLVAFELREPVPEELAEGAWAPLVRNARADGGATLVAAGPAEGCLVMRAGLESPLDVVAALEALLG